jgi:predicted CopG family antitoxin
MQDIKYPIKCFRISEEIYKDLKQLKREENLTWNILFRELIKGYKMSKLLNPSYYEQRVGKL